MPYTTEQFVRGAVGELLRGAAHGKFWCQTCLAKFALETLGAGYHKRDIGRAMDKVFEAPRPAESNTRVRLRPLWENDALPGGADSVTTPRDSVVRR